MGWLIAFDPAKRDRTLAERGLDFARVGEIFAGRHLTTHDDRAEYGEDRFVTIGRLGNRIVVVVWTPRGSVLRIISMRKANERESKKFASYLD